MIYPGTTVYYSTAAPYAPAQVPVYSLPVEAPSGSVDASPEPMLPGIAIEPMPNEAAPATNEPSTALSPTDVEPALPEPIGDDPAVAPQPDVTPAATSADVVPAGPFDALTAASSADGAPTNEYAVKAALSWLTSTATTSPANVVDLEAFRNIAKWLWSPLLGFVGGLVALRLYHRREREGQTAAAR
jgi:hypothetical protein